jgi:hypothetical protein
MYNLKILCFGLIFQMAMYVAMFHVCDSYDLLGIQAFSAHTLLNTFYFYWGEP